MVTETEIAQVTHPVATHIGDHIEGFRALNSQRRDIRLEHPHIHAARTCYTAGPQLDVTIGNRQPDFIFADLQQHRIIDQGALVIADRRVFALADGQPVQIARSQVTGKRQCIGAFQRDLSFNGDIPHGNTVDQPVIFRCRIAIAGRHIHVVVDAGSGEAGLAGGLKERAFADTRPK